MPVDNPYYFCNDPKSPRTPDSQSSNSSRGFSIFKRRNSKNNSPCPRVTTASEQTRLITSANLDSTATLALGSPRGTFGVLNAFPQQSFELQPINAIKQHQQHQQHQQQQQHSTSIPPLSFISTSPQHQNKQQQQQQQQQQQHNNNNTTSGKLYQRRTRSSSSSSHTEIFRERFSSCSDTQPYNSNNNTNNIFDHEHGGVSNSNITSSEAHHHHHHHHDKALTFQHFNQHQTLPSFGPRRHSFGSGRQHNEHDRERERERERFHHNLHNHQTHHHLSPLKSGNGNTAITTTTLIDEVPQMMAPRPPPLQQTLNKYRGGSGNSGSSHKRRDNCGILNSSSNNSMTVSTTSTNSFNMDDILIVTAKHSERAILRANFLKNHFDKITKQRGRKPFNFLHIKIEDGPFSEEIANKYQNTALQIIILCPALLALSHSLLWSQLSAIIRVEKVLGILLEVTEEKIKDIHKSALPNYLRWRRCHIRENDQAQISNILGIATDILGRALCQRPLCHDSSNSTSLSRNVSNCSDGFTILPKKVKIGQNKVVAMLNEPLEHNDILKVVVEKSGELIEIRSFKCRNPYTIQFAIPESCMEISTMIEIRIEKNNKSLGGRPIKCESRVRELEQLLRTEDSPIEFMCHALGIGPTERDDLDYHLLQCFQKNMPPNFHLLSGSYYKKPQAKQQQSQFTTMRETSPEEYPTLLHFAAKWGLTRLCMQLLECPGGETACGIRNSTGKTPAELAECEGHHKLARNVISFTEFHELTTMYHYFKGLNGQNQLNTTKSIQNNNTGIILGQNHNQTKTVAAETVVTSNSQTNSSKFQTHTKSLQSQSSEEEHQSVTEYMDMSTGSDRECTPELKKLEQETRAVSNLNYISVESESDSNLLKDNCQKKFDMEKKIVTSPEMTTKELLITEPPYYASKERNQNPNLIESSSASASLSSSSSLSPYQTDKFSQECSQLLENCVSSTTVINDYVMQPSRSKTFSEANENNTDDGNYLCQPSNIPVEMELLPSTRHGMATSSHSMMMNSQQSTTITYGSLKRSASNASSSTARSTVDDELAEIMHDFKNNVLSIREVEVLVEKWKHRNDVQQSFREKQEQIDQLRKEYERIQDQVRTKLKRDTPFDKFKKLFLRHKEQKTPYISDVILDDTKSSVTTSVNSSFKSSSVRPISSSSLQSVSSSGSSGRLSTVSNCSNTSMVDSGTHSDHEERRFGCRLGSPGSLIDNYLIPPPPRPILFTPNSTPGDDKHNIVFPSPIPSSCSRLNSPTSPLNNSLTEHYQMFPSNIPVYNSQNINQAQSNNYLNTIMEANPEPENNYQNNTVTVQTIKLNDTSNIIYGKLNKITPNCSSFKPCSNKATILPLPISMSTSPVSPNAYTSIKVEAEVYQNVGHNAEEKQNEYTEEQEEEEKQCKEEAKTEVTSNEDPNHNYMNC